MMYSYPIHLSLDLYQLKELLAHGAAIQGMRESDNKKAAKVTPDTSPQKKLGQVNATNDENMKESNDQQANKSPLGKKKLGISDDVPPAKRPKVRLFGSL